MLLMLLLAVLMLGGMIWLVVSGTVTGLAMWLVIFLAVSFTVGALSRIRS